MISIDLGEPIALERRELSMGLEAVDFLMKLEDEFGIRISDEEAERLQTLDNTVDYLVERLRQGATSARKTIRGRPAEGVRSLEGLTREQVLQKVRTILSEVGIDLTAVDPTTNYVNILNARSRL